MVELPAERNVLAGHVIERAGSIPGLEGISRIFGEVWSPDAAVAPLMGGNNTR